VMAEVMVAAVGSLSELVVCDDVRGDPLSYRFPGVLTNVIVILVLHVILSV
jgi:hypothetical protein